MRKGLGKFSQIRKNKQGIYIYIPGEESKLKMHQLESLVSTPCRTVSLYAIHHYSR